MMFKKITIEVVMAVLWLFKSKVKRPKLKAYLLVAVLYFLMGSLQGQENKAVDVTLKGIQIGQQVPDVLLRGLHNYKDGNGKAVSSVRISDFKGKLLILDFFATWCSPCIAMIPKMDSLQREFGDKVAFLSVTYQSEKEVLPFLERLEKQQGRKFDLPVVTGDGSLAALFPHVYLPHYVWIDRDGVLRAITSFDKVNRSQLSRVIAGESLEGMSKKSDFRIDFDISRGLFVGGNGGSDSLVRVKSVFSGFAKGMTGSSSKLHREVKTPRHSVVLLSINQNIKNLFRRAYGEGKYIPNSRLRVLVRDTSVVTSKLTGNNYVNWLSQNGYCYELSMPIAWEGLLFKKMQQDLEFNFPQYLAGFKEIETECLVLVRTDPSISLTAAGEKSFAKFSSMGFELSNKPIVLLIEALQDYYMQHSAFPIVNETGLEGQLTFKVDANLSQVSSLNEGLKSAGLALVPKKRKVRMLVISDRVNEGLTVQEF